MMDQASENTGIFSFGARLLRRYPRRSFIILICFIAAGVMEGFSVASLLPLMAAFQGNDTGQAQGGALFALFDQSFAALDLPKSVGVLLTLIIALAFAKAALQFLAMRKVGNATASMANQLRQDFIRALMQARWSYFATASTGRITNSLITEADRAALSYLNLCKLIADSVIVVVYIFVASLISWKVTLAAAGGSAILMAALHRLVVIVKRSGRDQTNLFRALAGLIADTLSSFKPIKAMGREEYFRQLLTNDTKGLWLAKKKEVLGTELLAVARDPLVISFAALGLYAAHMYAHLSLPVLMVLAFMFLRVAQKMTQVQISYQKVVSQESAYWAIIESTRKAQEAKEDIAGGRRAELRKTIKFENVGFSYQREGGVREQVLRGVTCAFPANKFNAIIGPSGSGKTTMLDITLGFYQPESGKVFIDDTPLSDLDINAWRGSVGYIPQDGFLLHDTIMNNVTLGREMTQEEVEEALERAGILSFVQSLSEGLNTVAGERGLLFSGGQRQRIALARALARKPTLLLLDEPTSALDSETETLLLKTLKDLSKAMTIIVISHSERVRQYADNVYVLDRGELADAA